MMRKVADGASGNFRGVCPILNRATVIPNTVCAYASCEGRMMSAFGMGASAALFLCSSPPNAARQFGFF